MLLLKGIIIGLSIAAPVGVIGVLCIQRTIKQGKWIGFLSGLGAATADMVYGAVTALGLTSIMDFLLKNSQWIQVLGGIFLLLLGLKFFFIDSKKKVQANTDKSSSKTAFSAYMSTFFLTLSNPLTILMFIGIFSGSGALIESNSQSPFLMVLGVFVGSALWWLFLSFSSHFLSQKINSNFHKKLHKISALVIVGFGVHNLVKIF